jgi:hypothetical protein
VGVRNPDSVTPRVRLFVDQATKQILSAKVARFRHDPGIARPAAIEIARVYAAFGPTAARGPSRRWHDVGVVCRPE